MKPQFLQHRNLHRHFRHRREVQTSGADIRQETRAAHDLAADKVGVRDDVDLPLRRNRAVGERERRHRSAAIVHLGGGVPVRAVAVVGVLDGDRHVQRRAQARLREQRDGDVAEARGVGNDNRRPGFQDCEEQSGADGGEDNDDQKQSGGETTESSTFWSHIFFGV